MFKILYLFQHLNVGGAEELLLTTLKHLDRSKFSPVVYCLNEKGEIGREIEQIGIPVKSLNKKMHLLNLSVIFNLIRIFKKEKPDILHTNLFFANIFGRVASRFSGIKAVVATLHNPDYTYEDNGKQTFKIRKAIDRYSAIFSNTAFIAVSDCVKQDFQRQLGFKNVKVLPNCIESSRYKRPDESLVREKRKELGVEDDDILILNVGRLHLQKGQVYLIEAFNLIRKDNSKCKLLIIGKGIMERELRDKVDELRLRDNVIFSKDRRDIPEIMHISDIFVFPSLYEGFGIALVEAMASGLPVIASDIEPLREIISQNVDGILVEKENPQILEKTISELINDKERRVYLGKNARKKAITTFDVATHIKGLKDIYKSLISNGG